MEYERFSPQEGKLQIFKSDDEKHQVFGWASVSVRVNGEQICDHHNDMIDMDELEQAAYLYTAHHGTAGEMHQNPHVGKLIESVVFTSEKAEAMGMPPHLLPQGWWVGFQIYDPDVWKKIKEGTYTMFSIEGTALRVEEVTEDLTPDDDKELTRLLGEFKLLQETYRKSQKI